MSSKLYLKREETWYGGLELRCSHQRMAILGTLLLADLVHDLLQPL